MFKFQNKVHEHHIYMEDLISATAGGLHTDPLCVNFLTDLILIEVWEEAACGGVSNALAIRLSLQ